MYVRDVMSYYEAARINGGHDDPSYRSTITANLSPNVGGPFRDRYIINKQWLAVRIYKNTYSIAEKDPILAAAGIPSYGEPKDPRAVEFNKALTTPIKTPLSNLKTLIRSHESLFDNRHLAILTATTGMAKLTYISYGGLYRDCVPLYPMGFKTTEIPSLNTTDQCYYCPDLVDLREMKMKLTKAKQALGRLIKFVNDIPSACYIQKGTHDLIFVAKNGDTFNLKDQIILEHEHYLKYPTELIYSEERVVFKGGSYLARPCNNKKGYVLLSRAKGATRSQSRIVPLEAIKGAKNQKAIEAMRQKLVAKIKADCLPGCFHVI